ncbi:hypothetical protein BDZ45DRAFT_766400 [Acephala macrosclerotiorum]|nr:hypothetical protein BDZ45DRAFT_766400 [Acephala macrosclerotiorum]
MGNFYRERGFGSIERENDLARIFYFSLAFPPLVFLAFYFFDGRRFDETPERAQTSDIRLHHNAMGTAGPVSEDDNSHGWYIFQGKMAPRPKLVKTLAPKKPPPELPPPKNRLERLTRAEEVFRVEMIELTADALRLQDLVFNTPISPRRETKLDSLFKEKWGDFDYFKESEYHHINSFDWLRLRPQCQQFITHISLDFNLKHAINSKNHSTLVAGVKDIGLGLDPSTGRTLDFLIDYDLESSCAFLNANLPNLKSIFLNFQLDRRDLRRVMMDPTGDFIIAIQSLDRINRFHVNVGLNTHASYAERDRERSDWHSLDKQALTWLLMPEHLFIKEVEKLLGTEEVRTEQAEFEFETEASLGWVSLHNRASYLPLGLFWKWISFASWRQRWKAAKIRRPSCRDFHLINRRMPSDPTSDASGNASAMPPVDPWSPNSKQRGIRQRHTPETTTICLIPKLAQLQYDQGTGGVQVERYWDYSQSKFKSIASQDLWIPGIYQPTDRCLNSSPGFCFVNFARLNSTPTFISSKGRDPEYQRKSAQLKQVRERKKRRENERIKLSESRHEATPPKLSGWLHINSQYHTHIRNLSLDISFNHHRFLGDFAGELPLKATADPYEACQYLSEHPINLKSIILFLNVNCRGINYMLVNPEKVWISAVRLLSASNRFEVRA